MQSGDGFTGRFRANVPPDVFANSQRLEKITLKVREIALRAGAFLRKERSGFDRSKVEKKNAHDYVSYVDKESERRIVAQLRELLPEAGFIAEEGSGSLTTENYCWLVPRKEPPHSL